MDRMCNKEYYINDNKIIIHEGLYIVYHVIASGEQTAEIAKSHTKLVTNILNNTQKEIQFLIDLNKCGKNSPQARDTWRTLSSEKRVNKVAIFGLHPVAKMLASFVMGKISKIDYYRFFSTEEDAWKWLKT